MFDRPDWKDAKAYADIEQSSLNRIAWEFLRRNPDYQKAFEEYALRVRLLANGDDALAGYIEWVLTPNPTAEMFDAIGNGLVLSELSERLHDAGFMAALPENKKHFEPLDMQHGKAWGLERMEHPAEAYSMQRVRFQGRGTSITIPASYGVSELEQKVGGTGSLMASKWLTLQIDLSLPIQVIESAVLSTIKRQRQFRVALGVFKPVNNRALTNARYLEYLRILDGLNAGVSIEEIGEVLAPRAENKAPDRPRDKRFRAAKTEANRLQADGYRVLPMLQKMEPKRKKK